MRNVLHTTLFSCLLGALLIFPLSANAGADATRGDSKDAASTLLPDGLSDTVSLSAVQLKDRGITVAVAPAGTAEATIKAPATTEFDPHRVVKIGPRLSAKVVEITKNVGDMVKRGDTLAVLDSVELGKVKARYLSDHARIEVAQQVYEREKKLVAQKISSQAELQQARAEFEQAKAALDSTIEELRLYGLSRKEIGMIRAGMDTPFSRYALTTPQAGIIEQLEITPGQTLTPEMTPIEVVDSSRMRVSIQIYERDMLRVAVGQPVTFTPDALPTMSFSGTVESIARALSPTTRTLAVRASLSNLDGVLRAGMFGNARIVSGGRDEHALIPVGAVQTVGNTHIVFKPVTASPGMFSVVVVKTGSEANGQVEILAGLSAGDQVVTKGAFALMSILTAGTRQDTD